MPIQLPDEEAPPKPARRRGWAFGCFTTGFGVAVLFALYLWWANVLPAMSNLPYPPEPNPNGYLALKALVQRIKANPGGSVAGNGLPLPPAPKLRPAVAQLKPDLDKLRKLVRLPFRVPRDSPTDFHFNSGLRQAARCLLGEGQLELADGRPAAAMRSSMDAVEMGAKTQNGGGLLSALASVAICNLGLRTADDSAERLSPEEAHEARLRWQQILSEFPPASEMIEAEEETAVAEFRKFARRPPSFESDVSDEPLSWNEKVARVAVRYLWPKVWAQGTLETYFAAQAREMKRPPWMRRSIASPSDPYALNYAAPYEQASESQTRVIASIQLLRLSLALTEFRGAHGWYPRSLTELSPGVLEEIPPDPFTGKGFVYRRTAKSYLLYSVGENRRDDGGTPGQTGAGDLVVGRMFPSRPGGGPTLLAPVFQLPGSVR